MHGVAGWDGAPEKQEPARSWRTHRVSRVHPRAETRKWSARNPSNFARSRRL